ncbi:MAG: hypothetical protein K2X12_17055 [Burkholderiaceae bacterium]|jgi:hypothetical protein|nr:hypothetical protein [Burkholderiaceae bacterium]
MRRRSVAIAALLPLFAAAEDTAMGSHGMAVFGGREGLYASHLPMFHAPHDHQVLLRFHLADPAADAALRDTLAREPRLWTFDPEPFDLMRLAPAHARPLRRFTARFHDGHFERGGRPQPGDQQVLVDEVLVHRPLDPRPRSATVGRYWVIGRGAEWFAVKTLDRRPDFDHLVRATGPRNRGPVTVPLQGLDRPGDDLRRALQAEAITELYFETDDLR